LTSQKAKTVPAKILDVRQLFLPARRYGITQGRKMWIDSGSADWCPAGAKNFFEKDAKKVAFSLDKPG
jgi:hypothetical protein